MMSNDRRWRRTLEGALGIPATEGNQSTCSAMA
jgi:hypothetical protein